MYTQYTLGDVCSRLSSGKSISASEVTDKGLFPVYGGNGLRGYTDKSNFTGECAIIGRQGAFCGNVHYFSGEAYMTEHMQSLYVLTRSITLVIWHIFFLK